MIHGIRLVVYLLKFQKYSEMFPESDELKYMATSGNGGASQGNTPGNEMKLFEDAGFYIMRNGWVPESTVMISAITNLMTNLPVLLLIAITSQIMVHLNYISTSETSSLIRVYVLMKVATRPYKATVTGIVKQCTIIH